MYTHIPSLVQLLYGKYVSSVQCVFATFFLVLCVSLVISLFEMSPNHHAALLASWCSQTQEKADGPYEKIHMLEKSHSSMS